MSKSSLADAQRFNHALDEYRVILSRCKDQLEDDPLLEKQITFWMESVRFLLTELEVWDDLRNNSKYDLTVNKVKRVMYQLDTLILQLTRAS